LHLTALASNDETAAGDDHLAADIIGFRTAEQIDGVGRFFWRAAAPERSRFARRLETSNNPNP
jgi:hypothetical protein